MTDQFGKRLIQARKFKELSQSDLAIAAGLEPSTISHFECGRRLPSAGNLAKLSAALGISSDFLLGLESNLVRASFKFDYKYLLSLISALEQRSDTTEKLLLELGGEALIKEGMGMETKIKVQKLLEQIYRQHNPIDQMK